MWQLMHVLGCRKPAFLRLEKPQPTDWVDYRMCRHLDGRPVRHEDPILCESCGQLLSGQDLKADYFTRVQARTSWEVIHPTRPGMRPVLHARRMLPGGAEYVTAHELTGNETPVLVALLVQAMSSEIEGVLRACEGRQDA